MPFLRIQTNCEIDKLKCDDLAAKTSKSVSKLLTKPENYVMVLVESNQSMCFDATSSPTVYMELKSLNFPEDSSKAISASLCELIHSELEVPVDRIYLEFSSPARHMWGWNKSTF